VANARQRSPQSELVIVFVGKVAAAPRDGDGPGAHFLAVQVVDLGVVALLDLDIPAGLRHRLCAYEALWNLHPERDGRLAVTTVRYAENGLVCAGCRFPLLQGDMSQRRRR